MNGFALMFTGEKGINGKTSGLSVESCIRQDSALSDGAETWIFRYSVGEGENDIGDSVSQSVETNLGSGLWEKQPTNSALQGHGEFYKRFRMVNLLGKVYAFYSYASEESDGDGDCGMYIFDRSTPYKKYGEWKVANTNINKIIFKGTNYYVLDPGQSRSLFTFATVGSSKFILSGGWDGVNILGDTWLVQNISDRKEGTSYFDFVDITDATGPHIPSRKRSAVFQYENHLIVFGGLVPTSQKGSSISRKRYSNKLWILYNMESYVQGHGSGHPTIPEERAYMDIKTFKYQGDVVGVMFGGFNGSPLDDTWLIVPSRGEQGIAWVRFHKENH